MRLDAPRERAEYPVWVVLGRLVVVLIGIRWKTGTPGGSVESEEFRALGNVESRSAMKWP
jgi:hypothetical protein